MDFPVLDISYEWNHTCGLLYLALFTKHNALKSHPCPHLDRYFIPFNTWIIFHHRDPLQLVYPFISWADIRVVSTFWLWVMLLWAFMYKLLCEPVFNILGIYLEAELLDQMAVPYLSLRNCQNVSHSDCNTLHLRQLHSRILISPHPCKHLLSAFLILATLVGVKLYLIYWGFDWYFSFMTNDVERLLLWLLVICKSSSEKLLKSFAHF